MDTTFASMEPLLHETASQMAGGLDDFGPPDYLPGLRVLLAAMDAETRFSPMGRQFAFGTLLGTLKARLHTQAGWKRRPEHRDVRIARPLVITGIPRTGTTALHKLLSMDPQFQGLERWLTEAPQPRPPRDTWAANPQFQATVAGLEAFFAAVPEMKLAHDMVADEVDECLEVLQQGFVTNRYPSSIFTPSYDRWFRAQDELPSYRRYADVLRLIGVDAPDRRWLLKNPGHVAQLDCLLEVFPDACVVQTHRDVVKAIGSISSTLHIARKMFEGDQVRLEAIGPRELDYWASAMESTARTRARHPARFHDVHHAEFLRDPMGVVRKIYERFDLALSPEAERRMRAWIAESPTSRHGEHRYDLTDYGVTAQQVKDRFAPYLERHFRG